MTEAGYSGTPLPRKLGIGPQARVTLLDAPEGFEAVLGEAVITRRARPAEIVLLFATQAGRAVELFRRALDLIPAKGAVWVAWPKKTSGIPTDLTEQTLRDLFLPSGLVDNKVAAIDHTWSGLRFVVRKENRPGWRRAST